MCRAPALPVVLKRYGISRLDEFEAPQVPERYFNQLPVTQGSDIQTYTVNPETLRPALVTKVPTAMSCGASGVTHHTAAAY